MDWENTFPNKQREKIMKILEQEISRSKSLRTCPIFYRIRDKMQPPLSNKLLKKFEKKMKSDPAYWYETTGNIFGVKHRWSYDRCIQSYKCVRTQDEDLGYEILGNGMTIATGNKAWEALANSMREMKECA
jgi:hypothetical protein